MQWCYEHLRSIDTEEGFEEYFQSVRPLHVNFIRVFKPYWLLKNDTQIGRVYCALLGAYCRLFEVVIEDAFQGREFGRLLLDGIRIEGRKQGASFILLQTSEGLRTFYEKVGFHECARNSIIRLKKTK